MIYDFSIKEKLHILYKVNDTYS